MLESNNEYRIRKKGEKVFSSRKKRKVKER